MHRKTGSVSPVFYFFAAYAGKGFRGGTAKSPDPSDLLEKNLGIRYSNSWILMNERGDKLFKVK